MGFHQSSVTDHQSPLAVLAIQFQEMDRRGFSKLDAEVACDLAQGMIEVGKMIDGHVADEGAANFVVACAAVQPTKKEKHLEARGETDHDPVGVHRSLGSEAIFCVQLGRNYCGCENLSK
jgi:hypothetical protein